MNYRNTPLDTTGCSPPQLLQGRKLRTRLPVLSSALLPNWPNIEGVRSMDAHAKLKSTENFNKRHGARPLPELRPGQNVRVRLPHEKKWSDLPTTITAQQGSSSYLVRNRKFLQAIPDPVVPSANKAQDVGPCTASEGGTSVAGAAEPAGAPRVVTSGVEEPCADRPDVVEAPLQGDSPRRLISNEKPVYHSRYGRVVKPVDRLGY
ncbi:hypothetical protein HAZT_HAZT011156 [Hyalella azteca]|uniref:Uncharacterized protein n=1 Tax=Hyalella azteca TaxID=294128 RepID=A0A6A0GR72_HYAAZ|nr:hypothetical protein HAZT_HAZT011156 [Hyalella azteca]